MTGAEQIAPLSKKVNMLIARHAALSAVFEHAVTPVFNAVIPQLALKLAAAAREMEVKLPDGALKLMVEEEINALVDRLERKIRSNVADHR